MTTFVGRFAELRRLAAVFAEVRSAERSPGRCVTVTGPAAVGKTRLIGEFLRRNPAAALFFAAIGSEHDVSDFAAAAAASPLPRAERFGDILVPDWDTALRLLGDTAEDSAPSIVVIDNAARLGDRTFDTTVRRIWQRVLADRRILLIIIGRQPGEPAPLPGWSDLALAPFHPAELAQLLDLDAAGAFDAYLASGGHPDIAAQWPTGADAITAIETMIARSPSVFEVRAELAMARRWGIGSQAHQLLCAVGPEQRSRAAMARATALPPASLDRVIKTLVADGHLVIDRPLSLKASREARYRIADPYLRLWMALIAPHQEEIARGQVDRVAAVLRERWPAWRAAGMQILGRTAMNRLAAAGQLPGTAVVGGYWTRFDDAHVDLVGVDDAAHPRVITFVGTMTWDRSAPFDHYDLASLIAARGAVPGVTAATPLVAVTAAGATVGDSVAAVLGPDELLTAWAG